MYFEYLPFLVFLFCTEQIAISTGIRDCCYAGCRKHTYIADIWNLVDSHIQDVCEMLSQCRNLPENGKIAWFRWKSIDHFSTFLFLAFLQPKILAFSTGPPFFVVILEENIVVGTAFQRFAIYKLFHTKTKKMLCIEMNLCTSRRICMMLVYRELYIRKLPCVDYTVSGRERYTLGGVYPPIHMYMLPTAWLCVVLAYARLTQLYMQHRIAIKDLGHIHDTYPIIMHQD